MTVRKISQTNHKAHSFFIQQEASERATRMKEQISLFRADCKTQQQLVEKRFGHLTTFQIDWELY